MANNQLEQPTKKRVLKKLRSQFLNKTPSEDHRLPLQYTHHFLPDNNIHILSKFVGLVETNRKIQIDVQHLNSFLTMSTCLIKENSKPGRVTLNLSFDPLINLPTWEPLVKRLESYGDLELATWALRIRKYFEIRPQVMVKFFEAMKSEDPIIQKNIQKVTNNAALACQEIESTYPFRRITTFTREHSTELLSVTFGEEMLKEMGFTLEGFETWSKENGLPTLVEGESNIQLDMAKYLLGCVPSQRGKAVDERPEFITYIYDKDGHKKQVLAQYIYIFDPKPEGFFLFGYLVIKKEIQKSISAEEALNFKAYKQSIMIQDKDINSDDFLNMTRG